MEFRGVTDKQITGIASNKPNPVQAPKEAISANRIREIRQAFESDLQRLQGSLGQNEHQSLLVAMYEGTENLLNSRVGEFQIHEYLETLKSTAQDLHNKGVKPSTFQSEMLRHAQDNVADLIRQS